MWVVANDLEVYHVKKFLRNGRSNGRACNNNENINIDDDNDDDDDDDGGDGDDDDDDYIFSKKIRYFFIIHLNIRV